MGVCCGKSEHQEVKYDKKLYKPVEFQQRMEEIIDFWFKIDNDQALGLSLTQYDRNTSLPNEYMIRWFKQNEEFDNLVKNKFQDDFKNLQENRYKEWELNHDGRLALIVISDQLSRAYYRGSKDQYMFDHISLQIAKRITSNADEFKSYRLVEKLFIIMPYVHSEKLADCENSVRLLDALIVQAEDNHLDDVVKQVKGLQRSAEQFTMVLKAFNRLPHRNALIGRTSTKEEEEYLKTGKIPHIISPSV